MVASMTGRRRSSLWRDFFCAPWGKLPACHALAASGRLSPQSQNRWHGATMSNYPDHPLDEGDLETTPFQLFRRWLDAAEAANLPEFNAMTLATASIDGKPSSRIVLLRGHDDDGFLFFTNYS